MTNISSFAFNKLADNLSIMPNILLPPTPSHWYLVWIPLNGVNIISLTYEKLCSFAELVELNLFLQLVVLGEGLAAVLKVLPHQFITEPAVWWGLSSC